MGIRALCAAAAVVVGMGSAAEAATYTGTFTLVSAVKEYETSNPGDPDLPDEELPGHWGVATGNTVEATFNINVYADWVVFEVFHGNIEIFNERIYASGSGYTGGQSGWADSYYGWKELTWDGAQSGSVVYWGENYPWYAVIKGTFSIDPAPVPLPATAALLPLGIGALVAVRKRRRAV